MSMDETDATLILSSSPKARLVVQKGSQEGVKFLLSQEQSIIGRGKKSDIVLQDQMVSRNHARIEWIGSQPGIEDLGSSNGTFVNNTQINQRRPLNSGDKVLIGQTVMEFQAVDYQSESTPASQTPPETKTQTFKKLPKGQDVVPSRLILTTASQANERLGHENLGFLSETHGFLPTSPPILKMPPGYEAWDEIAESLPDLWRSIRIREALHKLPVLSAAKEDLPDEYLLRASVILSILAHAYHRISEKPPEKPMPDGIQLPWEQINSRLDRLAPHLSYIDLILYNWRLIDPDMEEPIQLSNLELMVSTVDNQEERVLYLMQVEAHYKIAPLLSAMVRAQEAVHQDDVEALKKELIAITDGIQHFGHKVFRALNPNPYSDTFVDPVVWAKTVAPFAVPFDSNVVGPSGVSAPSFHVLDIFFSRDHYDTHLGKDMLKMRDWYPKHWRDFFDALNEISVANYVENRGDPILSGIYKEATMVYAGESGFLSRHKLMAYGYLDIGFKVGRSVTIGGFSGLFKDRIWDNAVDELTYAQVERESDFPQSSHHAPVKKIEIVNPDGDPNKWVKQVVFDVSQTGMRYLPGDRCAVLPENSEDLVDKTLTALKAKGYETIPLTAKWREAINLRKEYEGVKTLPLRTLLKFGRIRPVDRSVAKALYAVSLNSQLRQIIGSRAEDQWELWDLVELLSTSGFDPKRIWKAQPGERAHICRIVPPESFRMYSISSTMDHDNLDGASELTLTIGRLLYNTRDTEVSKAEDRHGTASHFLGDTTYSTPDDRGQVSLKLVHPPRFSLPDDPSTPIVMFAGGTGMAPFRGFILERARQNNVGDSWLFLATRTREEFYYKEEFEQIVAKGRLHIRPAFSYDPVDIKFVQKSNGKGQFVYEPGEKRYIGAEMLREENASELWDLLRSKKDGGKGAYFYICGRTGFANSVMAAIKDILRRSIDLEGDEKEDQVNQFLYQMVGEERYMQDIFTTYTGSHIDNKQTYDASEIVLRNDDENGYWMVINGRVYDLTEFSHLHPGGFKIILSYAGMDATQAYQKVLHDVNPEVDSMLGMYEIGVVRRLDFGMEWSVVVGPDGLRFISLADAYRVWMRFLYNVVEMENALFNDYSLKELTLIANDSPDSYPPIKLQYLLEVHDRFILNYLQGTTGPILEDLWAVTSGICSQNQDVLWIKNEVERIRNRQETETVKRLSEELQKRINDVIERNADESDPTVKLIKEYCSLLESEDKRFLHEVKMTLRAGVKVFEEFERDTVRNGGNQLLEIARQIPKIIETYNARVLSRALGTLLEHSDR